MLEGEAFLHHLKFGDAELLEENSRRAVGYWIVEQFLEEQKALTGTVELATGSAHVGRGGGWNGDGAHCRSAFRNLGNPDTAHYHLGFRLARQLLLAYQLYCLQFQGCRSLKGQDARYELEDPSKLRGLVKKLRASHSRGPPWECIQALSPAANTETSPRPPRLRGDIVPHRPRRILP